MSIKFESSVFRTFHNVYVLKLDSLQQISLEKIFRVLYLRPSFSISCGRNHLILFLSYSNLQVPNPCNHHYFVQVTDSIYDLVGADTHPRIKMQNVEAVFSCMDSNRDGIITREEFVNYCSNTNNVARNLAVLP